MTPQGLNVLILCTGNSARSILAEALLNHLADRAGAEIAAYSAGSRPKGEAHPAAIAVLKANGHPVSALRSKSWDEFALSSAPHMDVVITVCDSAAGESCPVWPGQPVRVHWGLPDPAAVNGSPDEVYAAFQDTYDVLKGYMQRLIDAAEPGLSRDILQARLHDIHLAAA